MQKPRVINGKLYARGHWYVCEEVKRRGSEYQLSTEEKQEIRRELELSKAKGEAFKIPYICTGTATVTTGNYFQKLTKQEIMNKKQ